MNLKDLMSRDLGWNPMHYQEAVKGGADVMRDYVAQDARGTLELYHLYLPKIEKAGLIESYEIEKGAIRVTIEMMLRGLKVDIASIDKRINQNYAKLSALKKSIDPSGKLNLRSSTQLRRFIFDKLGKPIIAVNGSITTSLETLKRINQALPCQTLAKIIEYKGLEGEVRALQSIKRFVDPLTDCIFPFLNPSGTETGRFSSSLPNLQNVKRDDFFRSLFIAEPGRLLICLDQCQIEPTILATLAPEGRFQALFAEDADCYVGISALMSRVVGHALSRSQAKVLLLAVMYGMSPMSAADLLGVEVKMGEVILAKFFDEFPEVRALEEQLYQHARKHGYVPTLLGRRRYIADLDSPDLKLGNRARRKVLNSAVQGTAAELFKRQLMHLRRALPMSCHMLLSIHDEVLLDCPKDEAEQMLGIAKTALEDPPAWFKGRLRVKGGIGSTWAEAKPD